MDPVCPAYDGAAITGLIPGLIGGEAAAWLPAPVHGAECVVLLLLDGLGWNALQSYLGELTTLASMEGAAITTVAPSTTASALTSLVTGLAPAQHGVVGFRMRVDDAVLNVLRWRREDGRHPPDPLGVQRHPPFRGRPVPVVTRLEFETTGFTEAHLRGARFLGWNAVSTLVEHCRRLVAARERFVYAYYPGVDTVAHEFGLHDEYYRAELGFVDELVGRLLDALPDRATVLVTSDHGQVHVGTEGWIGLEALHPLVDLYGGDGRFRYLYSSRGAATELLAVARDEVGDRAWVFSRDQLLDEGWLGKPGPGSVRRRIGEVVLAARDPVAFADPTLPGETALLAAHGSLTPDEMLVPLLAARGRRRSRA